MRTRLRVQFVEKFLKRIHGRPFWRFNVFYAFECPIIEILRTMPLLWHAKALCTFVCLGDTKDGKSRELADMPTSVLMNGAHQTLSMSLRYGSILKI